jgi:hypothetical protein
MSIIESKVRPKRENDNRASYRNYWWQFAEKRTELYRELNKRDRVLAIARISNAFAFAIVDASQVLNEKVVVFTIPPEAGLALLQARPHEIWTRFFSTTLKEVPRCSAWVLFAEA